ncbi:hypothetical protein TcWFU_009660 [Taenia crassiceps]|uniref:Uncharacterized protein n=1 Tax=Taenia crassiceps TaxID=6207 RepID=A0ABR4QBW5_9CEST
MRTEGRVPTYLRANIINGACKTNAKSKQHQLNQQGKVKAEEEEEGEEGEEGEEEEEEEEWEAEIEKFSHVFTTPPEIVSGMNSTDCETLTLSKRPIAER